MATATKKKPPKQELGTLLPGAAPQSAGMWWSALLDEAEHVPKLKWPQSRRTIDGMRRDGQIKAMEQALFLPVRNKDWRIDPNGAPVAMARALADDLGLRLVGEEGNIRRAARRFNFSEFLQHALLAPPYGFNFFEIVGKLVDETPRWRLHKLAPRLPSVIHDIRIDDYGSYDGLIQLTDKEVVIPAEKTVGFIWDREGSNWYGTSIFRGAYKYWSIKERLLRIDAVKHDKNAVGIAWAKIENPDVDDSVARAAFNAAVRSRASGGGGVLPYGVDIEYKGVTGTLPDTIASIRYMDEQMARSTLTQFLQLGQTEKGSYGMSESFIDFFGMAVDVVADWFARAVEDYFIERWVDWNYGDEAEYAPRLVHTRRKNTETDLTGLVTLVTANAIKVDDPLEDYLREQLDLPPADEEAREQAKLLVQPLIDEQDPEVDTDDEDDDKSSQESVAAPKEARAQRRRSRRLRPKAATPSEQPKPHETAVQGDALDKAWQAVQVALVAQYATDAAEMQAELVQQVTAAGGNLAALAKISATTPVLEPYLTLLRQFAGEAVATAVAEAERQSVSPESVPDANTVVLDLAERTGALLEVMATDMSSGGAREAMRLSGPETTPEELAAGLQSYFDSLTDSYPRAQLGGLVTTAMNDARFETQEAIEGEHDGAVSHYHSSLLDPDTCADCRAGDGTKYDTLAAARKDFPAGKFKKCQGRERCRCIVVGIYEED